MHYIVLDLEWNNTYAKKRGSSINEIIEIGAVRLDEQLREIDCFSQLIRAQIGRKLHSRVKKMTNLSNADVAGGDTFSKVVSQFLAWVGEQEHVLLTWGNGDIRVFIENYDYHNNRTTIPWLQNYADLQQAVQSCLPLESKNQIGLGAAAELLRLPQKAYAAHRALDDSRLGADCLRKVFTDTLLPPFTCCCDAEFYQRLRFKPYTLHDLNDSRLDKQELYCHCASCGNADVLQESDWCYRSQYFRSVFYCPVCGVRTRKSIRFKVLFDCIAVRHTAVIFETRQEEEETSSAESSQNIKEGAK